MADLQVDLFWAVTYHLNVYRQQQIIPHATPYLTEIKGCVGENSMRV